MAYQLQFPDFKPIQLEDRDFIRSILLAYEPQTSEWTFTNLFIWRSRYGFRWCMYEDWLLVTCKSRGGFCAFQPIGPPPRVEAVRVLLGWLGEKKGEADPRILKADKKLVSEIQGETQFAIEPVRDHFDYVYKTEDLIQLAGRKYHSKRNHLSKFKRTHSFGYAPLGREHVQPCLDLAEEWCQWRRCEEDMNLLDEWEAVREALNHFDALELRGGVILIGDEVKAFSLGEALNGQTAVVHVEKADPEIPELYSVINQQFCEGSWSGLTYVNREQDLGMPGLRKAKLSYYPDHLVEKFDVGLSTAGGGSINA
jgi:hypothetical protein